MEAMKERWAGGDPWSLLHADWDKGGGLGEHLRLVALVVAYGIAWFAKLMLVLLPSPLSALVLGPESGKAGWGVVAAGKKGEQELGLAGGAGGGAAGMMVVGGPGRRPGSKPSIGSSSPVGRALCQVLALVNDIPASSRKYEFARGLAEAIVEENHRHGGELTAVNKAALGAGFHRTVVLLARVLARSQRQQQQQGGIPGSWLWSWIPVPGLGAALGRPLPGAVAGAVSWAVSLCQAMLSTASGSQRSPGDDTDDLNDAPEKLAQELLWISEKMVQCHAVRDAVLLWANAAPLAFLSISAPAKVQRSLVRLSVLLCRGLVESDPTDLPSDVRMKLLLLWLPLFCNATHGGDGPIFSSAERASNEKMLEQLISVLPEVDQEEILSLWLHEYAFSHSDWPNLQHCYTNWCNSSRKLGQQQQQQITASEQLPLVPARKSSKSKSGKP